MFEYVQRKWNALGAITRAGDIGRLTADEVEARLGELTVLDANPRFIFEREHLPGARHVEYDQFAESELPADKDAPLLFYCHNGL
jgi:rhodanese-related sulfurtransferase